MTKRAYNLSKPKPRTELIAAFYAEQSQPYWSLLTQAERDQAVKDGNAMPDGSYPIRNCDELADAVKAVGRGSADHDAIRRHIMRQAEKHNCAASAIPDNWNADGSLKDDGSNASAADKFADATATPAPDASSGDATTDDTSTSDDASSSVPTKVDPEVAAGIEALKKSVADLQALQATDPDATTDPADEKVLELLDSLMTTIQTLEQAQAVDSGEGDSSDDASNDDAQPSDKAPDAKPVANDASAVTPPAPSKTAKLAVANTTPVTNPVDEDGNVQPGTVCTTEGCGHLASMHQDQESGDNSGPCQALNCECPGMSWEQDAGTETDPEGDDSDGSGDVEGGGPDNAGGTDTPAATSTKAAKFAPGDAVAPADPATPAEGSGPPAATETLPPAAPANSNPAPEVPGSAIMGPAFTIPVGVIEGQETGDGRSIALDALTWNAPPMPLMGLATSTHDPMGFDMNDPSIICGRIDSLERVPGENGTQIIMATGFFLDNDDGAYFADLVEQMGRVGISADIAVIEAQETISGMDEMGWPEFESRLTLGLIQGFTIVPFPAFEGAYIVIGDGTTIPEIPQTVADAMPVPDAVTAGGQLVHYMTQGVCEPCAKGYDSLVASGVEVPVRPPKAWFEDPNFTFGDGRLKEIYSGRGDRRVGGEFAVPFTITDEGEVYGHIAPWSVCHTGETGTCIVPPRSKTGYAQFMREGQRVKTAEGDEVTVGVLTFDTGHASTGRGVSASSAMAHYDNTGTAFADVVAGEDEFGIWVHGALRPGIDELQLRRIKAASPSGDWREMGGNLELVACLQVNQPGFPVAVVTESGRASSLVAAGAYVMAELREDVTQSSEEGSGDVALRAALRPILEGERERIRKLKLEMQKQSAMKRFARLRKGVK